MDVIDVSQNCRLTRRRNARKRRGDRFKKFLHRFAKLASAVRLRERCHSQRPNSQRRCYHRALPEEFPEYSWECCINAFLKVKMLLGGLTSALFLAIRELQTLPLKIICQVAPATFSLIVRASPGLCEPPPRYYFTSFDRSEQLSYFSLWNGRSYLSCNTPPPGPLLSSLDSFVSLLPFKGGKFSSCVLLYQRIHASSVRSRMMKSRGSLTR